MNWITLIIAGLMEVAFTFCLGKTNIHIANWGRKFAETEIIRAERSLIPHLSTTASDRYENLLNQNPALLNRIPLEKLASYLGITPPY